MTEPWLRPVLTELPQYAPAPGLYSGAVPTPLSANESPHEPLPGISRAITEAAGAVNRYPDPGCHRLTRALARARGVDPGAVLVGAGSVALLQALFHAIAEPGAEVVHGWPSFELYPSLAALAGVASVPVPLRDGAFDLPAIGGRISTRTRMVLLCSPNNPTGGVISADALRGFLARVPPRCLVVLDEAYHEYVRDPAACNGVEFVSRPQLVVLRTFSKAYGLAGLRVGYLLGAPGVVSLLRKALTVYEVSAVAQAAAVAALSLQDELLERVAQTVGERRRTRDGLLAAGYSVPDSQANFLWLPLSRRAADFGEWCRSRSIAVRVFPGEGVRVTIGRPHDNDALLSAAAHWRQAVR
ncbi:histidinol-phosphate transaminase [Actinoplanes sp. NPDC051851]|uniref:histidinol-phosphate transaminase n=1 Tax=Actinoplanes sp. NPDC051851 TaxID=3154753 RepID=UPI0034418108